VRTGPEVGAWARNVHSWHPIGMCQQFTRSAFGVPAYYGSAALAWRMAAHRHPGRPSAAPANVPGFFTGGSRGFGHAVVMLGRGLCRSTDWPHAYSVSTARVIDIERVWGLHYVGWTEDINRVQVYIPRLDNADGALRVHLRNLQPGLHNNDVRDLQKALRRRPELVRFNPGGVTGFFGDETRAMVRAFQRQQGWTGSDADGLVGPHTARLLGLKVV
jgi:hypothetical protein